MMKKVVWVIGKTGAGKTTLIKDLGYKPIFIGKACREKFGAAFMANTDNPTAPTETDSFVDNLIYETVKSTGDETIIVDGYPRKPEQVDKIVSRYVLQQYDYDNIFLFVNCDTQTRYQRLKEREKGKKGDRKLTDKRLQEENNVMLNLYEYIFFNINPLIKTRIRIEEVNTTTLNRDKPLYKSIINGFKSGIDKGVSDTVSFMLSLNNQFSNMTFKKAGVKLTMEELYSEASTVDELPPMSESMQWTRRFTERAIEELQELLDEIPVAWWSKQQVNVRKARVELIDAWHFILSAMFSLGMSGTTFANTYVDKREVNVKRQVEGYTKLKKKEGDDSHVGKQAEA